MDFTGSGITRFACPDVGEKGVVAGRTGPFGADAEAGDERVGEGQILLFRLGRRLLFVEEDAVRGDAGLTEVAVDPTTEAEDDGIG